MYLSPLKENSLRSRLPRFVFKDHPESFTLSRSGERVQADDMQPFSLTPPRSKKKTPLFREVEVSEEETLHV